MRFFILRTPLRFGENTLKKTYNQIMYNSRTKSTLCPASLPEEPQNSPTTHQLCRKYKTCRYLSVHVLVVYDFHFRSIPFQELRSFLTLTPDTPFHFHSNHTLQHPAASGNTHFHFASFIHSIFSKPFSSHFQWYVFHFCDEFAPLIA